MSGKGITRAESGEVLQTDTSVSYDQLVDALKKAGIYDDYAKGDAVTDAEGIANALAEHKQFKSKSAAPDEYDLTTLPDDIQHPDGAKWSPDPDFAKEISGIFKDAGLDQATASKLAAAYARHGVKKATADKANRDKIDAATKAEMAKLGANGQERIDAVTNALVANHGKDARGSLSANNAKGVEILEELIKQAHGEGRMSPTAAGDPGKPDLSNLSGRELLRQSYASKG